MEVWCAIGFSRGHLGSWELTGTKSENNQHRVTSLPPWGNIRGWRSSQDCSLLLRTSLSGQPLSLRLVNPHANLTAVSHSWHVCVPKGSKLEVPKWEKQNEREFKSEIKLSDKIISHTSYKMTSYLFIFACIYDILKFNLLILPHANTEKVILTRVDHF